VNPYSAYEWLSFLVPGGVILFSAFFGWKGWPYHEPGATALVGILGAAFAVGQLNAAVSSWIEPVLWRHRPGSRQDPAWGMFGDRGTYPEEERARILTKLQARYGQEVDFLRGYNLAYTELQQAAKVDRLDQLNREIGFHRNMTTACIVSAAWVAGYAIVGRQALPAMPWLLIFILAALLFAYRYRRFWRRFGDYVIRGFKTLR
jgi:hypothetical protein